MMRKILSATILLAMTAAFLTGCSTESQPKTGWVSMEEDTSSEFQNLDKGWGVEKDSIVMYLFGSSTCIPTPEETTRDGDTLTVKMKEFEGVCTMDYGGPYRWKSTAYQDVERIFLDSSGKLVELPKLN